MSDAGVRYSHRPKPVAGEITFRIADDTLMVGHSRGVEQVPLSAIERVCLTYEIGSFGRPMFRAAIRVGDGRKLALTNVSWRGFGESRRQDETYRDFVHALIGTLARAAPACRFEGGRSKLAWLVFSAMSGLIIVGLVAFILQAATLGAWAAAAIGLLAAGWTAFQLGPLIARNKPCAFTADSVPRKLLP